VAGRALQADPGAAVPGTVEQRQCAGCMCTQGQKNRVPGNRVRDPVRMVTNHIFFRPFRFLHAQSSLTRKPAFTGRRRGRDRAVMAGQAQQREIAASSTDRALITTGTGMQIPKCGTGFCRSGHATVAHITGCGPLTWGAISRSHHLLIVIRGAGGQIAQSRNRNRGHENPRQYANSQHASPRLRQAKIHRPGFFRVRPLDQVYPVGLPGRMTLIKSRCAGDGNQTSTDLSC
jgi:hypothetical protein